MQSRMKCAGFVILDFGSHFVSDANADKKI